MSNDAEYGIPLEHGTVVFDASDGEPGIRPKTCAEVEVELQEARRLLRDAADLLDEWGEVRLVVSEIRAFLGVDDANQG